MATRTVTTKALKGMWFTVKDNSMTPRYFPGELVFVRQGVKPADGDFAVIIWRGNVAIRQVFYRGREVLLKSYATKPMRIPVKAVTFSAAILYSKSNQGPSPIT